MSSRKAALTGAAWALALPLALAACSRPAEKAQAPSGNTPMTAQTLPPAPELAPPADLSAFPAAQAIEAASWSAGSTDGASGQPQTDAQRNLLVKVQVLLQRAHFSPGEIDGKDGGNLKTALAAFEAAHDLPADGKLDAEVWGLLSQDSHPVMSAYVVAPEEVAGPFTPDIPKDLAEQAKLDHLNYTSALEGLAERFHMSPDLLSALNPGVDFSQAGARILVVAPASDALDAPVTRIEVDKSKLQVRAFADDGRLLAVYPATVGSTERPAPSGTWEVRAVAPNPTYTYDPSRLTFGKKAQGKMLIKAGPNNPVGATWIDLTKDTYGIHGTPEPAEVGKVASHGCVRLTNWDAKQLGKAVKAGTSVVFVGTEQPAKKTKL